MRLIGSIVAAALLFAGQAHAADSFLIGVIGPLSGPLAMLGDRQVSAVRWWQHDVNEKGGIRGRAIELSVCDDRGNPEAAVNCTRDLIDRHSLMIINLSVAGAVSATMPLVKNGPVMIVGSPFVMPDPSTYVFQTAATNRDATRVLLAYLEKNHAKRLAMIAATDVTGEVGVADAKAIFPPAGIDLALRRIDLTANDATIQLAAVAKDNPPLIFSIYSGAGAVTVVKSYANLGLSIPLLVNGANVTDAFIKLIRNDMPSRLLGLSLKSIVPSLLDDPLDRTRAEYFAKSYEAWKKEPPDQVNHYGVLNADCVDAVLRNVANPGDPNAVRKFLETTPIHSVLTIRFSRQSHIGTGIGAFAVLEYKGKNWSPAGPL